MQRDTLELARRSEAITRGSRNAQIFAAFVAVIAVLVAVLAWRPWAGTAIAHATLKLLPPSRDAVIPKPISQVSTPPPYSADLASRHCGVWWRSWLVEQGAAEVPTRPLIEVSAPAGVDVTIAGAKIRIFRAYTPSQLSLIECFRAAGGGPAPGTLLEVDLAHPDAAPTIVADDGSNQSLSLPDAVINVEPGHTEFIAVTPHGDHRFFEWSLELRAVIDKRSERFVFGTRSRPLRSWLGSLPAAGYDYDMSGRAWRRTT